MSRSGPAARLQGSILAGLLALIACGSAQAAPNPRADASASADSTRCNDAANTLEIVACQSRQLAELNSQLRRYLASAQTREQQLAREDGRRPESLLQGQKAWEAYRSAACAEVYQHWGSGSIRGPMTMACQLELTRERLLRIWSDFLTFPDGSPPLLPKPG